MEQSFQIKIHFSNLISTTMGKLDGKVAVITGGNSGIGLATAKLFLSEGAKVAITGRRQEALDELEGQLTGEFITVKADAASLSDSKILVQTVVDKLGNIDVLFLNAGVAPFAPVTDTTEEFFDNVINTNLKGPYFTVKEAIPFLNENAAIILNTSIANQSGFANMSVYAASKAGLRAIGRVLASELASKGIRTTAVSPGPIDTPIYGKLGLSDDQVQELGAGFASQVPLGRFGSSEEIAKSVLFLASADSSYVNGIELEVDGGMSQV